MKLLFDGQVIRGTYEVERFLGEGAFAEVYRVKHRFLGRQAMKVFKRVGMDQNEIHQILGEAILLSRVGHPNIVRVFDANVLETERGICGYFTMEHVSGGSLEKFWKSHGKTLVPLQITLDIIKQVCRGLSQAHNETPPIIHRDIKPQNILVGYEADGLRARVSDFGLAKKVNPLTLLATAAGTQVFKAPEVFHTLRKDSCSSDVWAIGTTLYLLLTDRLPYGISSTSAWTPMQLLNQPLIMPSSINPDVDQHLDTIVGRALEKRNEARYQTAGELLSALEHRTLTKNTLCTKRVPAGDGPSKAALGSPAFDQNAAADELLHLALKAKENGRLAEAADLMEEAFNKIPNLREKHAQKVRLWRRGVSM